MSLKGDSRAAWLYPVFAIVVGLLVLDAVLLANDLNLLFTQQNRYVLAYERMEQIDGLLHTLTEAEAEHRGYLLTGRKTSFDAKDGYTNDLRAHQAAIQRLYRGENDSLIAVTSRLLDSTITRTGRQESLYDQGDHALALSLALADTANDLTEPIFSAMEHLREAEQDWVTAADTRKEKLQDRVIATFAITTIVALGLIALLYLFVARDMRHRSRIERALRKHRDELDGRVQARTHELMEANANLKASIEELARSNRELEEFAYVASHDLQEPLRKLRVFSDMLLSQEAAHLSDDGRHFLGRIHSAAERMSSLINDLLTYSRVRSRQEPFAPVDLNVVLQAVRDDLEETLVESGATLEIDHLPTLEADPTQMRQLLHCLLENAMKFRRPEVPPFIRITADLLDEETGPTHRITFRDNGIGFDPRYADRIFKPFQRLHTQAEYPGTGIGLAICRRIAERHGAELSAEGRPGEGATFHLIFPASSTSEHPVETAKSAAAQPRVGPH